MKFDKDSDEQEVMAHVHATATALIAAYVERLRDEGVATVLPATVVVLELADVIIDTLGVSVQTDHEHIAGDQDPDEADEAYSQLTGNVTAVLLQSIEHALPGAITPMAVAPEHLGTVINFTDALNAKNDKGELH